MSQLTLAQLRTEITEDQATQLLIDQLTIAGFSGTSWQSGSEQRTTLEMMGWVYASSSQLAASAVDFAFNEASSGDALTEFSDSHYDNQRVVAGAAQHTCTLTCAAGSGPYTPAVGDLVGTDGVVTFRNITGGEALVEGGTLDLTFQAETTGAAGNVAVGTITTLNTPLAGVTINNPDLGAGTSVTTLGQDDELDPALQARNRTKWASLPIETPADGYEYIARTAVSNIRVKVDDSNPRGPGTIDIYIAGGSGVATSAEEAAVQAAYDARIMGALHDAVISASDTVNFVFTVYYESGLVAAELKVLVDAAITAYVNGAPIDGYDYSPGPSGVLLYNDLTRVIEAVEGVTTVVLTTPAADFSVTAWRVAIVGSLPGVGSYQTL